MELPPPHRAEPLRAGRVVRGAGAAPGRRPGRRFCGTPAGPFEIVDQRPRRRVPPRGLLVQAPVDDAPHGRRTGRRGLQEVRRGRFEHPRDHRHRVRGAERMPAGGEFEQQHPEGEDVGADVDRPAPNLLRRHVARGAQHRARRRELRGRGGGAGLRIVEAGESEVDELDAGVRGADHVVRLQVPMQDVPLVGGRESAGNLDRGVEEGGRRQRSAGQLLPQRRARHVLAHDAQGVVELLERIDGGDAGMGQAGRGARLAAQAPPAALVPGERRGQRLDRHQPAEPRVLGEVHHPHAAPAELPGDPVRTEPPAGERIALGRLPARERFPGRGRHGRGRAGLVVREKRLDLGPQRRIPAAGVVEEPGALLGALLQSPVKQLADPLPAIRIHRAARLPSVRPPAPVGARPWPASSRA